MRYNSNKLKKQSFHVNMYRIAALILIVACSQFSLAQIGMGQWRMHISPKKAVAVTQGNGAVYAALTNGLLEYDLSAGEITIPELNMKEPLRNSFDDFISKITNKNYISYIDNSKISIKTTELLEKINDRIVS